MMRQRGSYGPLPRSFGNRKVPIGNHFHLYLRLVSPCVKLLIWSNAFFTVFSPFASPVHFNKGHSFVESARSWIKNPPTFSIPSPDRGSSVVAVFIIETLKASRSLEYFFLSLVKQVSLTDSSSEVRPYVNAM